MQRAGVNQGLSEPAFDRDTTVKAIGIALVGIIVVMLLFFLLPMSYKVPVILGVVQGLSEFLPISSSAHLIIVPRLLGWQDPGLTFDVALHVGTLFAVVGYFWRDWLTLLRSANRPSTQDGRLFWYLVLATLPGGLVGLALDKFAETQFRSLLLIAVTSSVMGLLLWLADRSAKAVKDLHQVTWRDALLVGAAQAVAILPGVSRSGITICVARAREMTRETAARFSFLLSTPIIAGAAIYKLRDLHVQDLTGPFFAGVLAAGIVGALTIALLLRYLRRAGFGVFAAYRLGLAAVLVLVVLFGK
jgi:undecaprenyl-diphosphatase